MIPTHLKQSDRPLIRSYDSGYEHSVEHWFDLKRSVEQSLDLKENAAEAEVETQAQAASA